MIMQSGKVFHLVQELTEVKVEDMMDCSAYEISRNERFRLRFADSIMRYVK